MLKGDETRHVILQRALAIGSKLGLNALSIGMLAKECCMSKSGLFAHFSSKENLKIEVLKAAEKEFINAVIRPSIGAKRGEPRLKAIFENWLIWAKSKKVPGGCIFLQSSFELDEQPGPSRDYLLKTQTDWMNFLGKATQIAIDEGHFKTGIDIETFVYQYYSLYHGYHYQKHLMRDKNAEKKALDSLESLFSTARK